MPCVSDSDQSLFDLCVARQPQGRFMLAFASILDAVRCCHAAQAQVGSSPCPRHILPTQQGRLQSHTAWPARLELVSKVYEHEQSLS